MLLFITTPFGESRWISLRDNSPASRKESVMTIEAVIWAYLYCKGKSSITLHWEYLLSHAPD